LRGLRDDIRNRQQFCTGDLKFQIPGMNPADPPCSDHRNIDFLHRSLRSSRPHYPARPTLRQA
jgi:hypothetical protein